MSWRTTRLIEPVRSDNTRWRAAHLNLLQRGAALWATQDKPRSLLLRDDQLAEAERWAEQNEKELSDTERSYLGASRDERVAAEKERQANRRVRKWGIAAGVVALIALGSLAFALVQLGVANEQTAIAEAQRSLAEVQTMKANTARDVAEEQQSLADEASVMANEASARAETQRVFAEDQRAVAQGVRLAAESIRISATGRLDLALLLGLEAHHRASTSETRGSLLAALTLSANLQQFLQGHTDAVRALAYSPDGRRLASGGSDGTIVIWRPDIGQRMGEAISSQDGKTVYSLAFRDSKLLASGGADGTIRLWNPETGVPLGAPNKGASFLASPVLSIAFNADGSMLASAQENGTIALWQVPADASQGLGPVANVEQLGRASYRLAFSSDGRVLAAGDADGNIVLWDGELRQRRTLNNSDKDEAYSVAFRPGTHVLAVGRRAGSVSFWDADTGMPSSSHTRAHERAVFGLAFSADGTRVATGSSDGRIRLWDADSQSPDDSLVLGGFSDGIYGLAFIPDETSLATGHASGPIALWNPSATGTIGHPVRLGEPVFKVGFSPASNWLVATSDTEVHVSDADTYELVGAPWRKKAGRVATLSADGKLLATGSTDGPIEIWDVATRTTIATLSSGGDEVSALAFSPDGQLLAAGGCGPVSRTSRCIGGSLEVWDVRSARSSGGWKSSATVHKNRVGALAFSSNGAMLASGATDGSLAVWDVASASLKTSLPKPVRFPSRALSSAATAHSLLSPATIRSSPCGSSNRANCAINNFRTTRIR